MAMQHVMAMQHAKKGQFDENLPHHHPEGSEEEVDKEWEEFTKLMTKLRENKKHKQHR